jgi:hypothetical protein
MASLRASAQSIAAYRSSSSQPVTPSTCPSELVAVSLRSPRAVASLDPGPITWATSIAVTRSRLREGVASMSSCMPSRCALPSTAATCPCGRLRVISNASDRSIAGGRPFSARFRVSTLCSGQCDRLARVRVFTLPSSR